MHGASYLFNFFIAISLGIAPAQNNAPRLRRISISNWNFIFLQGSMSHKCACVQLFLVGRMTLRFSEKLFSKKCFFVHCCAKEERCVSIQILPNLACQNKYF